MSRKSWTPIIERAANIVYEYDTAVTLRQVFYRLVAEGLIPNTESAYKRLSYLTAKARREDEFPSLLDRTRSIERAYTYASPVEAVNALAQEYRRDVLEGQETLPMIVVEKATLIAQVSSWFDEFCVPVAALRGYASESFERVILDLVDQEQDASSRSVVILYCGDFDPTGEDIPRAFEENTGLVLESVALTSEQVDAYDLPPAPGKATDTRADSFLARHGRLVQVELEALPPETLRSLLTAEFDRLVDTSAIEAVREREEAEREALIDFAEAWEDAESE
jgi:hypothetical protein